VLAVGLGLAASVAWGSSDFFAGLKTRTLGVLEVLLVSQAAGLVVVLAALAAGGAGTPSGRTVALALLAGAGDVVGFAALYRGLAIGCMCLVAPISATAAVVPLLAGVLSGERPNPIVLVALVVVLAGVALGACERSTVTGGPRRLAAGAGLGLLAAMGFGVYFTAMGTAADGGPLLAVAVSRATTLALLLIAAAAARYPAIRPGRGNLPPLAAIGVLDALANVFFAVAVTKGLVSVVSVLGSLCPITTVLLAATLLGERPTRLQRVGATGCLVGVGTIAALSA
jgi:drug/metabolite transporter (DMT)-like permease